MKKILFIIMILFVYLSRAQANTVQLVSNRFDNTYVYYYDGSYGRTRYLEASKYSFNGNIAYCLEIGKYISSMTYDISNSFDSININKDDLDYIKTVSYYGYDYPGHHTDKFYMATQEIIWTRLIRTNIKWTTGFDSDVFANLENEKNEIYSLYRKHNLKPSFSDNEIDIVLGKKTVLEDINNVISLYNTNNKNVTIDGNNIIFDKNFSDKELTLERTKYNSNNFILYSSGNSQKMMSVGSIDIPSVKLKFKYTSGSIRISKYDSEYKNSIPQGDGKLDGAIYGLYNEDNKLIDKFVIGKKNIIDNLPIGKYYVKEIEPSIGYMIDDKKYDVLISENNLDINLNLYEEVIKRKIDLFKVLSSDKTGIMTSEKNITFEIYDKNNNLVNSITTDSDGYASVILPYGKYLFKQINSYDGYYKIDDFEVNVNEYDDRPIYKLLSDSEIKAKLKVIKKDKDTLENIIDSKCKFKIFDVNNNKYVSFNITYPEKKTIDVFEINKDGYFITPDYLSYGKYILYEVDDKMNGYLYNKEGIEFEIGDNSNFIKEEDSIILEIPFYNKRVKGKIVINKYGEDIIYNDNSYYYKEIFLGDTCFNLYAKDDIYENNNLIYEKDELVETLITDSGGVATVNNLPLGNYYLKETKSSNNNIVDDNIYDIELKYKDQYTDEIVYEMDVYNYLEKGTIVINKFDKNSGERLSNTLIEIRNKNDNVIYKGYTNENGQIIIDDLLYGDYYISEVEASTGYKLLDKDIYFSLNSDIINIDIYNERIELPNTGINFSVFYLFICLILLLIIFILFFFRNRITIILSIVVTGGIFIYFGYYYYNLFIDNIKNDKAVNDYYDNKINKNYNEKYKYTAILEIPSIKVKRGILDTNNKYNDVKYNIKLISSDNDNIILAAHNGNYFNSYFGNLKKLELNSEILYYFNDKLYKYIYSESYVIKKNGYADIYHKDIPCIILITCLDENDSAQIVHIGYLKSVEPYKKG